MKVQELIDQLLAIGDKTLEVWLADNDCCEARARNVLVKELDGHAVCYIDDCPPRARTLYERSSEVPRCQQIMREAFRKFEYEVADQRTSCALEQFVHMRACDMELWDASKFVVQVVSDPREPAQPMVQLRPVPMTAVAFNDILGHAPENDDLERINCDCTGGVGHLLCGWCDDCWRPRFICGCVRSPKC
jgi:hypothetical protein